MSNWISEERFLDPTDLDGEEWLDFTQYPGRKKIYSLRDAYQISNKGRIRNKHTGKIRKPSCDSAGYVLIDLLDTNDQRVSVLIHRAVLYTFEGPPSKELICKDVTVNHKNHDTSDNRLENLEWLSRADNIREANCCPCKVVDNEGEHIFSGKGQASRYLGRCEFYITDCIQKGIKITSSTGESVKIYLKENREWVEQHISSHRSQPENFVLSIFDSQSNTYIEYQHLPKLERKKKYCGMKCKITDSTGEHLFESLSQADIYLGKQKGVYIHECLKYDRKAHDKDGNEVQIELVD